VNGDRRGSNSLAAGDLRETPFQVIKAETVGHCESVHAPLDWIQHVEIHMNIGWHVSNPSLVR